MKKQPKTRTGYRMVFSGLFFSLLGLSCTTSTAGARVSDSTPDLVESAQLSENGEVAPSEIDYLREFAKETARERAEGLELGEAMSPWLKGELIDLPPIEAAMAEDLESVKERRAYLQSLKPPTAESASFRDTYLEDFDSLDFPEILLEAIRKENPASADHITGFIQEVQESGILEYLDNYKARCADRAGDCGVDWEKLCEEERAKLVE